MEIERIVKEYVNENYLKKQLNDLKAEKLLTKVAAYARVSTDSDDQLNSYAHQCKHYTEFIRSNPNWEFVGLYADEGITGTSTKNRKQFLQMIDDAMDGRIEMILCKSISRFSRNVIDSISYIRKLRDNGVRVIFDDGKLDTQDPKNDLTLNILSTIAEQTSRDISYNVRWGVSKKFDNGEVIFNFNNLLGYEQDKKTKEIKIIEKEAEVIREIYFRYLNGETLQEIKRYLECNNIKTATGKDIWNRHTIRSILQNEKYIGDAILQKTYQRDFLNKKRVLNVGQAKQKYVENNQ